MWAIRILSGPQAGQVFPLKFGSHVMGRAPTCDVKIASNSVSKEHAKILATDDKLILTDLNSRNGTFVNGMRIQMQRLNVGDKLSLHDIILDVLQVPEDSVPITPQNLQRRPIHHEAPSWAGNAAAQLHHSEAPQADLSSHLRGDDELPFAARSPSQSGHASADSIGGLLHNFKIYIDNVAMPAVYGLVRLVEFRWALAILVLAFVFAVTSLTIIPIVTTTRENIQAESIRRAKTIARNMRDTNKRYIIEKNEIAMDIRAAELEEGVTAALIISAKEGTILAPANKRGEFANRPFVNKARRDDREVAEFIDDSTVGVAIPISFYNPETGNQSAAAFAIVIYDTGALVMNSNQVLSLYIQTLAIGLLVGLVLFFLLFKIVEHPIEVANFQLDDALREGRDDLQIDYKFEVLEKFLANINSALSRIGRPTDSNGALAPIVNRDIEASNVVRMLPVPAMTINALDDRIVSTNVAFDRLVGGGVSLQGRPVTDIPDPSLPLQLAELLPRMRESVSEIAISQIPFPEGQFEIRGQTILGGSEPAYYLITLNKTGVDGG